jgi:hypothetical protein
MMPWAFREMFGRLQVVVGHLNFFVSEVEDVQCRQ